MIYNRLSCFLTVFPYYDLDFYLNEFLLFVILVCTHISPFEEKCVQNLFGLFESSFNISFVAGVCCDHSLH